MQLKDFITSAITDIADAIIEADEAIKEKGGLVNPGIDYADIGGSKYSAPSTKLDFDIAISAKNTGKASTGVRAKIFVVEASLGGEGTLVRENVSRLSFSVDVVFPHDPKQATRIGRRKVSA